MPPSVTPDKSHSDNREYRIFTLDNGLQILVITDETTDKVCFATNFFLYIFCIHLSLS